MILNYPVLLFIVPYSPYKRSTFTDLSYFDIKPLVSDRLNYSDFLLQQPLDLNRVMNAERVIITEYTSPTHLEERMMADELKNTSIPVITENLLTLYKGVVDCHPFNTPYLDVRQLSRILLLYPSEVSSSVFSPLASYIAESDLFESFQVSLLSDALASMYTLLPSFMTSIDIKAYRFFTPLQNIAPYLFDLINSIFDPKSSSAISVK